MMWGGAISGTTISADLWEWDGNDWSLVAATNAPAGRNAYSIAFDDARGRLVMFNGALFSAGETWEYEPRTATWSNVNAPPPPGVGTLYASSTFDARAGQIVAHVETGVFGPTAPGAMIRYTPGPSPTFAHYGTGCAASSGTPVLTAATGAVPALGTTLPLQIAPLPATPGLVVFAFGFDFLSFQGRPLPVGLSFLGTGSGATPLCNLWIALADFVAVPHAGATAAYGLTIPAAPRLAGLRAAAQGLVFDAFAANGVGAVTNAAILRVF
jgi:hypothetical protein